MSTTLRNICSVMLLAIAAVALSACDTQPATNVTQTSATLNAKGDCAGTSSGTMYFELRQTAPSKGDWTVAGTKVPYTCNGGAYTGDRTSHATGLMAGATYEYRLVVAPTTGSPQHWDSNGVNDGTSYDTFTTQPVKHADCGVPPTPANGSVWRPAFHSDCPAYKGWGQIRIDGAASACSWNSVPGTATGCHTSDCNPAAATCKQAFEWVNGAWQGHGLTEDEWVWTWPFSNGNGWSWAWSWSDKHWYAIESQYIKIYAAPAPA